MTYPSCGLHSILHRVNILFYSVLFCLLLFITGGQFTYNHHSMEIPVPSEEFANFHTK